MKSANLKKNLITPEKAAWFIPVFISSGISILLILFFAILTGVNFRNQQQYKTLQRKHYKFQRCFVINIL